MLAALLSPAACTHLVKRPSQCGPPPAPLGHSALGWQRVATMGVTGSVLEPGTLAPIGSAQVLLTPLTMPASDAPENYRALTDASGAFRIDSVPPARYVMRARRIGYRMAQDTIRIAPDSGLAATALLTENRTILDHCDLTYQLVRVPWWSR